MKNIILLIILLFSTLSLYGQGFLVPIDTASNKAVSVFKGNVIELSNNKLLYSNNRFGGETGNFFTLERNGELVNKVKPQFSLGQFIYVLPDNSQIIIGGGTYSLGSTSQIIARRFDANNSQVWTNTYTDVSSISYANIVRGVVVLEDGFLVYGANVMNTTDPTAEDEQSPYMFRIDLDGNLIWEFSLDTDGFFQTLDRFEITRASNENQLPIFDYANTSGLDTISFVTKRREYKIDTDGNIISDVKFERYEYFDDVDYSYYQVLDVYETQYDKLKVDDGEIVLSTVYINHEEYDPIKDEFVIRSFERNYISKFSNGTRDRLWIVETDARYDVGGNFNIKGHVSILPNGNVMYIPAWTFNTSVKEYDISDGNLVSEMSIGNSTKNIEVFATFPKDGYVMCVASSSFFAPNSVIQFFKVDDNLKAYDFETTNIPVSDRFALNLVTQLSSNEYAGFVTLTKLFDEQTLYAFRADSNGVIYSNEINGDVSGDLDFDCLSGAEDIKLEDWEVRASNDVKSFTTLTDENGDYKLQVDTGKYELNIIPRNDYWLNCDTTDIEFTIFFDTLSNVDLVTSAITPCSFVEVDVGIGSLRRCFSNRVVVQYCNQGTFAEEDVMVELNLDSYLDVDTTSIPISSQEDTTYFFDIGELGIGECGDFTIHVTPNCDDTFLGQEHCIEAHVFPDTLCVPMDSLWSGANVVVEAICLGDSVLFEIANNGSVSTKNDLRYIVIVDDIIISRTDQFSLAAGGSIQFVEFEPESSITVIADQEPFHPAGKQVGITAFCAGTDFDFISAFNQFDDDPFTDIVCADNRGSFDPNDKAAIPEGVGPEHFIPADQELEYKIRFQNTGTDTAFTVVIRDTISNLLDMTTFETGVGSHDYVLDIEEENILVFTFNNILLPDSTVNWTESNGFIEFKISPVGELVPDDVIENSAAIFFDFNEPIITNTVVRTIETPLVFSIVEVETSCHNPYNEVYYVTDTTISEFFYGDFQDSIAIVSIKVLNTGQPEIPYNGIDDDCNALTLDDDLDQDGFSLSEDCDDTNATINSAQVEIPYNGIDDDCNSLTLDDDLDQDGYSLAEDCDDTDATINPAQLEIPYNGIDDDCNAFTLDDDLDQDGYSLAEDCDDTDATINPAQLEIPYNGIDDDCNALTLDDDLDQDGYSLSEDCDDTDATINPAQLEIPYNGIDDDCNALTLENDLDQDGYSLAEDCDDTNAGINAGQLEIPYNGIDDDCDALTLDDDLDQDGYSLAEDCDDANAGINAGQFEIPYNGIDDDCDALTLDDDLDQDGYFLAEDCDDANAGVNTGQLEIAYNGIDDDCDELTLDDDLDQDGFSLAEDCDDTNAGINVGQLEIPYNGIDDDCNVLTLDDDLDQDGYPLAEDCDDTNANINTGRVEIPYNGIDDDCDALTLDDDLDQDGYPLAEDCDDTNANINSAQVEIPYNGIDDDCNALTLDDDLDEDGYSLAEDCDDTNANINSAQVEIPYNGIDDDCNALTLDDDLDEDGFSLAEDCDDTNAGINSAQVEIPYNGIDDDCDELTLDDDLDEDGFSLSEDCDDTNGDINPDAVEIPSNEIDEDCDGMDLITSIKALENTIINIYPNPVIDVVNIEIVGLLNYDVRVYDLLGNLLLKELNQSQLRIENLPAGTYLLTISYQHEIFTEKIVIQR